MSKERLKFILKTRFKLIKESDRGACLMAISLLEVELESLLSSVLILDKRMKDKVFNGHGPLSSLSSKLDMSFSMGYITKEMYQDFNLLRKIRNEFAHSPFDLTFESQKIKSLLDNLHHCYYPKSELRKRVFLSSFMDLISMVYIIGCQTPKLEINRIASNFQNSLTEKKKTHTKINKEFDDYEEFLVDVYKDFKDKDQLIVNELLDYASTFNKGLLELIKQKK